MIFYKDNKNCIWYIDVNSDGNLYSFPFGYFVLRFLNTINSWENKERFIRNESAWLNPDAPGIKDANITDADGKITNESLGTWYDKNIERANKDIWWEEYQSLLNYIKNLNSIRNGDYGQPEKGLFSIYENFKYFATMITNTHLYEPITPDRIKKWKNRQNDFIQLIGYGFVGDYNTPCEIYETHEEQDIFIIDFWEYLFNPKTPKTRVCKECDVLFASNNTNATYCDMCKNDIGRIRYKNRRNNKERFLHKTISDQLRLIDETLSNNFLNESNYYWDIVQGKIQTVNTSYRDDITTKDDYMKWLEGKKKQYEKKEG